MFCCCCSSRQDAFSDVTEKNTSGVEASSPHKQSPSSYINQKLNLILAGVNDPGSYLSVLCGSPHIVEYIWNLVKTGLKRHIKIPYESSVIHPLSMPRPDRVKGQIVREDGAFFKDLNLSWKEFPEPTDININMMPFIAASNFEDTKLPDYLKLYRAYINCVIELALFLSALNHREGYSYKKTSLFISDFLIIIISLKLPKNDLK